jgi:HEAT repeat protein
LFLNSFGQGSGFGTYQLVEDVMSQFSVEQMVPHLVDTLRCGPPSTRYWVAQIAANFPHPALIEPLRNLLFEGNEDEQSAAVTALEMIQVPRVDELFQKALKHERSEFIRELIADAIDARRNQPG